MAEDVLGPSRIRRIQSKKGLMDKQIKRARKFLLHHPTTLCEHPPHARNRHPSINPTNRYPTIEYGPPIYPLIRNERGAHNSRALPTDSGDGPRQSRSQRLRVLCSSHCLTEKARQRGRVRQHLRASSAPRLPSSPIGSAQRLSPLKPRSHSRYRLCSPAWNRTGYH